MQSSRRLITQLIQTRSMTRIRDLKGTHLVFKHAEQQLSPINGAAFSYLKTAQDAYDNPTHPTHSLVRNIFHKLGKSEFITTRKITNPGHHLNPLLIAKLTYLMSQDKLNDPDEREQLSREWREISGKKPGKKAPVTLTQINSLIDIVLSTKKECSKSPYTQYFTEMVLLAFLRENARSNSEVRDYLKKLHSLDTTILDLDSKKLPTEQTIESIIKTLNDEKQTPDDLLKLIDKEYETLMLGLMTEAFLPQVISSKYGYGKQKPQKNCMEAALHNLCNILIFDDKQSRFNLNLLPSTLNPHPKLVAFYQTQEFKTDHVNTPEIGQAFMNLMSGIEGFKKKHYCENDYELNPSIPCVIDSLNYLFGTHADSFAELSTLFSDHRRTITFSQTEAETSSIEIILEPVDGEREVIDLFITNHNHAELNALRFYRASVSDYPFQFTKTMGEILPVLVEKYPMLCKLLGKLNNGTALLPYLKDESRRPVTIKTLVELGCYTETAGMTEPAPERISRPH